MKNLDLRFLSKEDIVSLDIPLKKAIDIVEQTYVEHAKQNVYLPAKVGIYPKDTHGFRFFHAMPAMVSSPNPSIESAGVKWVSYFPGNKSEKDLPDASCLMILNDVHTGLPYCIMEGMHLTNLRTAAAGAIAAKRLAAPDASVLGIVGAGVIARWSIHAILSELPGINEIKVTSRTKESRERLCAEMEKVYKDVKFTSYSELEALVSQSDIALSITSNTTAPYINFDWLKEGALALSLDGIKSWDSSFTNADHIISDDKAYLKTELERYYGEINLNSEICEIGEIIETSDRLWSKNKRNIAFMTGVGSTDVTVGKYIYDQAVKNNAGTVLPLASNRIPVS
ncbi:ornithine cyclodeaminase family protein [Siminovitchia sediminis]|uniref:Ornithine cyclodeaminase family protein n=1 Tax=Siminovitchia sediminis TaxID=1274353 RepID=A0ABW4KGJ1_9BACI